MRKPPCKGCPRRFLGCHSICPQYCVWKKEHDAAREKERAAKTADEDLVAIAVRVNENIKKARKRHG